MNVKLALLADYANVSREGKLNILGIFDVLKARSFPVAHPTMQLVITFEASRVEVDNPRDVRIKLTDADGGQILELSGPVTFKGGVAGEMLKVNHIITFNNIIFPKEGTYTFHIFIDKDHKANVPLKVNKIQQ